MLAASARPARGTRQTENSNAVIGNLIVFSQNGPAGLIFCAPPRDGEVLHYNPRAQIAREVLRRLRGPKCSAASGAASRGRAAYLDFGEKDALAHEAANLELDDFAVITQLRPSEDVHHGC